MTKIPQYRIKIKSLENADMGDKSTFKSKRVFMQNRLWDKIKEGNIAGTVRVEYSRDYWNEFNFTGIKDLKQNLDVCTEPELLREFAR